MVKIVNPLGDVKVGRQGEAVYQRKYGEQIRRTAQPKRGIPSQTQIAHRELYRAALDWRKQLSLANRRYLEGYCLANWIVDDYKIPLPWHRFALKLYLQHVHFVPDLELIAGEDIPAAKKDHVEEFAWSSVDFGQNRWGMQSITPSESYTLGKVVFLLFKRLGVNDVHCDLHLADGAGKPTGASLATGETNGNTLPVSPNKEWRDIEMSAYDLEQGVQYCLVLKAPNATGTDKLRWWRRNDDNTYTGGTGGQTTDGGLNWELNNLDMHFEVWCASSTGEDTKEGTILVRHPALMSVVHKRNGQLVYRYDNLSSLDEQYLTGQVGIDVEAGDTIEATTFPGIQYKHPVL